MAEVAIPRSADSYPGRVALIVIIFHGFIFFAAMKEQVLQPLQNYGGDSLMASSSPPEQVWQWQDPPRLLQPHRTSSTNCHDNNAIDCSFTIVGTITSG
jgi:hypothetical protein